jgi:predicted ATPase
LRDVLKVASVEGEAFTAEVVAQVQGIEPQKVIRQLSSVLDQQHRLVQSWNSRQIEGQRLSTYRFRHILFQQYLYEGLDEAEQVYLHEAVGRSLEQLYSGQLEEMAGELARHFQAAGLTMQAVNYLHRAGRRAVQLFANEEAIAHFTQALSLLDTLPDTSDHRQHELTLQLALSTPLVMLNGYAAPAVEAVYSRAWVLCQQFGEPPELAPVLRGLWDCYLVRAEHRRAYELAEQLFSLAQRKQEPILLMEGHWAMGETLYSLGELLQAQEHQEETITRYNLDAYQAYGFRAVQDPGLSSRYFNAATLWLLGYPDSALKQITDTLALAQELSYPFDLASTFFFAGILHQFRRQPEGVQARAEAVLALAEKYGFTLLSSWGTILRGWALTQQGQGEAGVEQLHRGLAAFQATGAGAGQPHYLALLAEAYRQVGHPEKGLRALDEALTVVDKSGESWWEAELYRLKGELLLDRLNRNGSQPDAVAESETCFEQALQIAHRQQAKSLELRAGMSLYRWRQTLQAPEQSEKSRKILAEVYNWFREGFDTADLQEARSLLEP